MIALSQLSREVEKRPNKRPLLSDLRESGGLEQDADCVLLLYRDEYYVKDSKDKGVCEVNVAKNRNGESGSVNLAFLKEIPAFSDLADEQTG